MKKKQLAVLSRAALSVLIATAISTPAVYAMDGDLHNLKTGEVKNRVEWSLDQATRVDMVKNSQDYRYEFNEKAYKLSELSQKLNADKTLKLTDVLKDETLIDTEYDVNNQGLNVKSVSAIDKTKVVTVKATAPNAEEGATADVAVFAYDEEGVRGETAVATETGVEIVEGAIEVEFKTLETGSYVAVVTVGEEEAEFDFTLDFKAVDAAVDAVNKADTQIKLREALNKPEFFDGVNNDLIVKYFEKMGSNYKTIAEIQKDIDAVNEEAGAENLVAEIKAALKVKDQIKLYELLSGANFVDEDENPIVVDADLIGLYETKLNEITEGLSVDKIKAAILGVNNEPINAINEMEVKPNNDASTIATVEKYADRLGLDLTAFNKLVDGRKVAVLNDLIQNKPEDGYTVETLKPRFDEIVETRTVFEESVKLFAAAGEDGADPLTDLTYITMLIDQLESVSYEKHSNKSIKEVRLPELQDLVDRFNALSKDDQTEVLSTIVYTRTSSSTNTRLALDDALKAVEAKVAPREAKKAVHALFATKVVDEEEVIDETKLAEGVTQADIDAASKLVEALPADSEDEGAEKPKADLQALIEAAQELFDVKSINDAIAAEDAVTLQNIIVELNVTEFASLTKAERAEIGAFMIHESKGEEYEEVTSTSEFAENVKTAITSYTTKIEAFNTAANKVYPGTAKEKAAVIAAIKDVMDLEGLTAIEELDLAEAIFEAKPENGYAVKTIAEIKAAAGL